MPAKRRRRADNDGLRAWLTERERELVTRTLTPIGYHHGKPIEPPPAPPIAAEVDAAIRDEGQVLAWAMGYQLRQLLDGKKCRLSRSDLPEWHPVRYAGGAADSLMLTAADEVVVVER